jgi:hypothetical protein
MKLIAVEIARSIQAFVQEEVRPLSGGYFTEGMRLITERYGFTTSPNPSEPMTGGAKFTNGRLIAGSRRINISELIVFSNALQATTVTNTSDADYIIEDIFAWAVSALGFREPQTHFPRLYESALIFEFEKPMEHFIRPFENIRLALERNLATLYGLNTSVAFSSFGMGVDPLQVAGQLLPPLPLAFKNEFGLVRRTNVPYSSDRFFSLAPLPTDTHQTLLQEFELAIPD